MSNNNRASQRKRRQKSDLPEKIFYLNHKKTIALLAVLIGIVIVFVFPISSVATTPVDIPYNTQSVDDSSIELGDSQTRQAGSKGEGLDRKKVIKPTFGYILGIDIAYSKKDLPQQTIHEPTNEIVAHGTKRYQYMWCSDGSYRYYSSDQFKSPEVGFTHKSPDACAKNGNGHMTELADAAPPQQSTRTVYTPSYTPSYLHLPTYTTCNSYSFLNQINCTTY